MKKTKTKKIILAILVVVTICMCSATVFAAITPAGTTGEASTASAILGFVTELLSTIGGILLKPLVMLAVALGVIIMFILGTAFSFVLGIADPGNDTMFIPFPDDIIFNKLAAFDPNFINPAKGQGEGKYSLIELMSKVISPIYFTGQTLVGGIFVILALIVGIKLAISATAQEKAQYKTAISKWVIGLFFLFVGHFLMAGVFKINEEIVKTVSQAADKVAMPVALYKADSLGDIVGNTLQVGINFVNSLLPGDWEIPIDTASYKLEPGYYGLVYYHALNSLMTQNFASLLMWYIMLGQTVALIILYFKRLFYSIFMGIVYPFTVAADTAQKIMGKNSNLLDNWIKNFTVNVFTQTFHAFILYFSLIIIFQVVQVTGVDATGVEGAEKYSVQKVIKLGDKTSNMSSSAATLLQIVCLMSVVAFEKLIREFTGMQAGKAGEVRGNGLQMLAGLNLARSGVKNIQDNFTGRKEANKKLASARLSKMNAEEGLTGRSAGLEKLRAAGSFSDYYKGTSKGGFLKDIVTGDYSAKKEMFKQAKRDDLAGQAYNTLMRKKEAADAIAETDKINTDSEVMNKMTGVRTPSSVSANTQLNMTRPPANMSAGTIRPADPQFTANTNNKLNDMNSSIQRLKENRPNTPNTPNASNRPGISKDVMDEISATSIKTNRQAKGTQAVAEAKAFGQKDKEKEYVYITPESFDDTPKGKVKKMQKDYTKSIADIEAATRERNKKQIASALSPGIAIAGVGIGMGTANSLDDVLKVSGAITTALDKSVEKIAETSFKVAGDRKLNTITIKNEPGSQSNNPRTAAPHHMDSNPQVQQTIINNVESRQNMPRQAEPRQQQVQQTIINNVESRQHMPRQAESRQQPVQQTIVHTTEPRQQVQQPVQQTIVHTTEPRQQTVQQTIVHTTDTRQQRQPTVQVQVQDRQPRQQQVVQQNIVHTTESRPQIQVHEHNDVKTYNQFSQTQNTTKNVTRTERVEEIHNTSRNIGSSNGSSSRLNKGKKE